MSLRACLLADWVQGRQWSGSKGRVVAGFATKPEMGCSITIGKMPHTAAKTCAYLLREQN